MKRVLVCATLFESSWLRDHFPFKEEALLHYSGPKFSLKTSSGKIDLLITGVGMVNTAFNLGRYFLTEKPDQAINFGVAGSFDLSTSLGEIVEVATEIFGDLGAEDHSEFLDLEGMGLSNFMIGAETVFNTIQHPKPGKMGPKITRGLTVNKVHGNVESIALARANWNPDIETMEGAAFFQCCLLENISFYAFRGISNYVEPRNRANWKLKEASENVQKFIGKTFIES